LSEDHRIAKKKRTHIALGCLVIKGGRKLVFWDKKTWGGKKEKYDTHRNCPSLSWGKKRGDELRKGRRGEGKEERFSVILSTRERFMLGEKNSGRKRGGGRGVHTQFY